jgi:hypothetical protein
MVESAASADPLPGLERACSVRDASAGIADCFGFIDAG